MTPRIDRERPRRALHKHNSLLPILPIQTLTHIYIMVLHAALAVTQHEPDSTFHLVEAGTHSSGAWMKIEVVFVARRIMRVLRKKTCTELFTRYTLSVHRATSRHFLIYLKLMLDAFSRKSNFIASLDSSRIDIDWHFPDVIDRLTLFGVSKSTF